MLKTLKAAVLALALSFAGSLYAECTYNGKKYSEGSVIGPYICKDGEWVRR